MVIIYEEISSEVKRSCDSRERGMNHLHSASPALFWGVSSLLGVVSLPALTFKVVLYETRRAFRYFVPALLKQSGW